MEFLPIEKAVYCSSAVPVFPPVQYPCFSLDRPASIDRSTLETRIGKFTPATSEVICNFSADAGVVAYELPLVEEEQPLSITSINHLSLRCIKCIGNN